MLKGGNPATVNTERFEMTGTSLTIQSVNANDSAWYRCKYMIGQTQRCFDINLLVQGKIKPFEITLETILSPKYLFFFFMKWKMLSLQQFQV